MAYRKAVFILTYSLTNSKPEYLILKRKKHWKGWEFPKGGVNKFEPKRRAVKRELFEETGMKPKKIKKFNFHGKYNYKKKFPERKKIIGQTYSLYAVEVKKPQGGKIQIDGKEHSAYKWLSYNSALKTLTFANQKKSLRLVNDWLKEKLNK